MEDPVGKVAPSSHRPARRWALLCATAFLLAACSSQPSGTVTSEAWAVDLQAAQRQSTSDFERDVLADGAITREEYVESVHRYIDCMRQNGYSTQAVDDLQSGVFQYRTSQEIGSTDIDDQVSDQCRSGSVEIVEPLYVGMLTNPMREDFNLLVLSCLRRKGLAPDGLSLTEFKSLYWDSNSNPPWNPVDDRVVLCGINPSLG